VTLQLGTHTGVGSGSSMQCTTATIQVRLVPVLPQGRRRNRPERDPVAGTRGNASAPHDLAIPASRSAGEVFGWLRPKAAIGTARPDLSAWLKP